MEEMSPQRESETETLVEAALRILNTPDPFEKARLSDSVASRWLQGTILQPYLPSLNLPVPDRPARLTNVCFCSEGFAICFVRIICSVKCVNEVVMQNTVQVKLLAPGLMPKLGKAGSLQSRQAIVHSLVHTESWAIDLSWVLFFFVFFLL